MSQGLAAWNIHTEDISIKLPKRELNKYAIQIHEGLIAAVTRSLCTDHDLQSRVYRVLEITEEPVAPAK